MKPAFTMILTILFIAAPLSVAANVVIVDRSISETEVIAAQQDWCKALIDISEKHENSGQSAAKDLAEKVIDAAYGYQMGAVLFKPTITVNPHTFRTTRDGALSYFVGGDPSFPADSGFALMGWKKCEIDNAAVFITGNSAVSMGKVHLTGKGGSITSVDKTWGFVKDDAGQLRIIVHHSSLEHSAD